MSRHSNDDEFWERVRKLLPSNLTDYSIEELEDIVEDLEISIIVNDSLKDKSIPMEDVIAELAEEDPSFLDLLNEAWEKDCE